VFERTNIVSAGDLRDAVRRLDTYSSASAVSNSRRAFAATNFIWDHAIETSQSIFVV
jgi:hypothetical protein